MYLGLFATAIAKARGASRVIVADINVERLKLAEILGADTTINSGETDLFQEVSKFTNGTGVPRLVEASGSNQMVDKCFKLLQKVKHEC